jgi:hypothetical protein
MTVQNYLGFLSLGYVVGFSVGYLFARSKFMRLQ